MDKYPDTPSQRSVLTSKCVSKPKLVKKCSQDSSDSSGAVLTPSPRNISSFLTPCRRMGLRRTSPMATCSPGSIGLVNNCSPELKTTNPETSRVALPLTGEQTPPIRKQYARRLLSHKRNITCIKSLEPMEVQPEPTFLLEGKNDALFVPKAPKCRIASTSSTNLDVASSSGDSDTCHILPVDQAKKYLYPQNTLKCLESRVLEKRQLVVDLERQEMYLAKHNIEEVRNSTKMWREACQRALEALLEWTQRGGKNMNMAQLIQQLSIPPKLVNFDCDKEDFF